MNINHINFDMQISLKCQIKNPTDVYREYGRTARGGHELPKVSPRPSIFYPSPPCRQATPETALQPFQGWPTCKGGGLQASPTLSDTLRRTPLIRARHRRADMRKKLISVAGPCGVGYPRG